MSCDQFQDRLNQLLDDRLPPESDAELRDHCAGCDDCRLQLSLTTQMQFSLSVDRSTISDSPGRKAASGIRRFALAALVLVVVGGIALNSSWRIGDTQQTATALSFDKKILQSEHQLPDRSLFAERLREPAISDFEVGMTWWQDITPQDWIDETMPAVESVQRSVAPLGRSLLRAVALLTSASGTVALPQVEPS